MPAGLFFQLARAFSAVSAMSGSGKNSGQRRPERPESTIRSPPFSLRSIMPDKPSLPGNSCWLPAQVVKSRFQAIAAQGIAIQGPAGFQFGDTPLRPVLFEQFAAFGIERHVGSQLGQHAEIEEARAGACRRPGTWQVLAPLQIEIGGGDAHAIRSATRPARQRPFIRPSVAAFAADRACWPGRVRAACARRTRNSSRANRPLPACPVVEIAPDAQSPAPLGQEHRVIDPGPPTGQVGVIQLTKSLPVRCSGAWPSSPLISPRISMRAARFSGGAADRPSDDDARCCRAPVAGPPAPAAAPGAGGPPRRWSHRGCGYD